MEFVSHENFLNSKEMFISVYSLMLEDSLVVGYFKHRIVLNFDKTHSSMIQDVIFYSPSSHHPLLYISTLDSMTRIKKTIETPFCFLIVQLWDQSTHLPESLQTSYSRLQNEHDQRTVDDF